MINLAREERSITILYALTDLLLYWLALSLAAGARWEAFHLLDFPELWRDRVVCVGLYATAAAGVGCYQADRMLDRFDAVYYGLIALAAACLAQFAVVALLPVEWRMVSRRELVLGTAVAAVLIPAWRLAALGLVARFPGMHRFFYVLGNEGEGKAIARELRQNRSARVDARYISPEDLERRMRRRARRGQGAPVIEEAIVTLSGTERKRVTELLQVCEAHCRRTYLYPNFDDTLLFQHQKLESVAGLPLIEVPGGEPRTPYLAVKRLMDFSVALTALVLVSPLLVVLAAAVGFTSPGGVFYCQERLGRHGRPFLIRKFRSMVADDEPGDGPTQRAVPRDPRVTPVGRFIRKYKLDELPQLWNVLRGDMSLIGPRPLWRTFFEENGEKTGLWERRLAVRPGLTSLLHVQGHSFAKAGDFLRYDLIYINNLSLMNDVQILVKTIRIVLSGKGGDA